MNIQENVFLIAPIDYLCVLRLKQFIKKQTIVGMQCIENNLIRISRLLIYFPYQLSFYKTRCSPKNEKQYESLSFKKSDVCSRPQRTIAEQCFA